MIFFEIRKYSERNFNLVQENHFFAVNTCTLSQNLRPLMVYMLLLTLGFKL